MTNIEQKALALVNEACRELDFDTYDLNNAKITYGRCFTSLCRAIERIEALSAENERLREALRDVLVYAPDFMHGMPKKHYEKIANGSSDD